MYAGNAEGMHGVSFCWLTGCCSCEAMHYRLAQLHGVIAVALPVHATKSMWFQLHMVKVKSEYCMSGAERQGLTFY